MTEDQIPVMALIALAGGMFAGLWAWRQWSIMVVILVAVVLVDVAGWITYGFIVNWQPGWGIGQIVGGILYAGFGLLMCAGFPAILGCFLAASGIWVWRRFRH